MGVLPSAKQTMHLQVQYVLAVLYAVGVLGQEWCLREMAVERTIVRR
jgi:hypothetical protein